MSKVEVIRRTSEMLADEVEHEVGRDAISKADIDSIDVCIQESIEAVENRVNEILLDKINREQEFNVDKWWE